jgi:hypothetical protein
VAPDSAVPNDNHNIRAMCLVKSEQKHSKSSIYIQADWKLCNRYAISSYLNSSKCFKKINTPAKAMETLKSYVKNVYQQSVLYYRNEQRGKVVDLQHTHLQATLIKECSDIILNTSSDQFNAIQNNLISVTSTLLATYTRPERPERQLELLFGICATIVSLYNYINQCADDSQILRKRIP